MNDTDNIKKTFAKNLRFYMDDYDLNQSDISKIAGVSKQSVSYWLNEKLLPRMGVIEKLADHFHILKSDLLEEKNESIIEKKKHTNFSFSFKEIGKMAEYEDSDLVKLGIYDDFKNDPFKYYNRFNEITDTIEKHTAELEKLAKFLRALNLPTKDDYSYEINLCENLIHEIKSIKSNIEILGYTLDALAEKPGYVVMDTPQKKREYIALMHDDYVIDNKTDEEINVIYQFLREQEMNKIHKFKDSLPKKQDD